MPMPLTSRSSYRPARWRWLLSRGLVLLLALAGSILIIISRTSPGFGAGINSVAIDVMAPVLTLLRAPVELVKTGTEAVSSYFFVHSRNEQLEKKLKSIQFIDSRYRTAVAENIRLKKLMAIREPTVEPVTAARIVGASAGSYVRSAILFKGDIDGVAVGQPVRDVDGLIGRVVGVGSTSSRVLLLTDLNSRIPVRVEETGRTGIVSGMNSLVLRIEFLSPGRALEVGNRLVTSGDGGTFPPGIPVATVSVAHGPELRAQPISNPNGLDFVLVLKPFIAPAVAPVRTTIPPQTDANKVVQENAGSLSAKGKVSASAPQEVR